MNSFIIDENTIWEETGHIKIYNYPPSNMTYSYVTEEFREYKRDKLGYKLVEGEPIYFNNMQPEEVSFAKIIAECELNLWGKLHKYRNDNL